MAGTAAYIAPEQIRGKPCPASDQYALGVIVYEWLSGERPFQGSQLQVIIQHAQAQPPPLRTKQPTISPTVEAVVMRALAKEPQQRFADVHSFAMALEQAIKADPGSTLPSDMVAASQLPPMLPPTPVQPLLREHLTAPRLVSLVPTPEQATSPTNTSDPPPRQTPHHISQSRRSP